MYSRRLVFALIIAILLLQQPTRLFAASLAETRPAVAPRASDVFFSAQQQPNTLTIGVLYPKNGAVSAYAASLAIAIESITAQTEQNQRLPQIDFIQGKLSSNEAQNSLEINKLIALGADALIAPNFLSALIIATQDNLDVVPLVSNTSRTLDLVLTGEDSIYSNLSEHSVIIRSIQKLKFRSRLQEVVLMYDQADIFGRVGYEVAAATLSSENVPFSTELFDANRIDVLDKLEALKQESPHSTVIIVGNTEDVAEVIFQAHDEIGLTGSVLGFIGDGNPAIYDLADRETAQKLSGVAWDVVPFPALTELVAADKFSGDRFAAAAYMAVWTAIIGLGEEHSAGRAGIRNSFIDHQGKYLEAPSADLAAWLFQSIYNRTVTIGQLTLPQVSQLNGSVAPDLQ